VNNKVRHNCTKASVLGASVKKYVEKVKKRNHDFEFFIKNLANIIMILVFAKNIMSKNKLYHSVVSSIPG